MQSLAMNKHKLVTLLALALLLVATHNLTANPADWFLLGLNIIDMSAPAVESSNEFAEVVHQSMDLAEVLISIAEQVCSSVTY